MELDSVDQTAHLTQEYAQSVLNCLNTFKSRESQRVETPYPDGPPDLETFRTCSGRPVCVSRDLSLPVVLLHERGKHM